MSHWLLCCWWCLSTTIWWMSEHLLMMESVEKGIAKNLWSKYDNDDKRYDGGVGANGKEHQLMIGKRGGVLIIIYNAQWWEDTGHLLMTDAVTIGRGYSVSIMSAWHSLITCSALKHCYSALNIIKCIMHDALIHIVVNIVHWNTLTKVESTLSPQVPWLVVGRSSSLRALYWKRRKLDCNKPQAN